MYNESYNNFTSQTKPLNITFMLIIIVAVMIVGILSYGIVRYYDFKKLQEVVCEEHRVLKKDLQKIKNNNDSLKNKKIDFNTHLNTYNNQNCIGEWINPDETNCEEVYKISQIKMGDGTPCEYEHDEKRERRETDGVCEPQNCVGEWNNCIGDERTYSVTTPTLRGGSCPAENGAIDRTTCVIQNRPPPNISSDDIQTTLTELGSSPTDEEIANKLANEYTQYKPEDFLNMISSLGSNATLQEKIDAFAKIDDPETGPGTASDGTNISSDDIQTTLSTLGSSPTNQEIANILNAAYSYFPIQEILDTISSLGSNATLQEKIDAIATIDDPETGPGSVSDDPETPSDVVGNNYLKTPVITFLTKALSNLPFFVNDLLS